MLALALTLLVVALAAIAGVLACVRQFPERPLMEQAALGLCAALAGACIAAYLSAALGMLGLAPLLLGAAGGVALIAPRPRVYRGLREPSRSRLESALAVAAILAALAWFALPVLLRPMPQGWDPAFHTSIIEMIRTGGGLPSTWSPYEPGERFNYPSGLHAALAVFGRFAAVPSHALFAWALVCSGALMLVSVYALGLRFGGVRAAFLAVFLYGLTSGWGTPASHAVWGGLPNLAGLALMAGFVLAVAEPDRRSLVLAALFAASSVLVHHLSFALLGSAVAFIALLELLTERALSAPGRTALAAVILAGLTAGVAVLLAPTGRFELAQALRFEAESMLTLGRAIEVMGLPVLVTGMLGLVLGLFTHRSPSQRLLPAWAVALLGFWVAFDVVYRAAVWLLTRENYTAFTPSRGLTDAAVPLSVLGAILLSALIERLPWRPVWVGAVAAALVALELPGWRARVAEAGRGEAAFAGARALCAEVRHWTPEDAVLFAPDAGEVGIWLPYLCNRELNYFPDPGYGMSEYRRKKAQARDPVAFARLVKESKGRVTYYATRAPWKGVPVAAAGGWYLYEVAP